MVGVGMPRTSECDYGVSGNKVEAKWSGQNKRGVKMSDRRPLNLADLVSN